MQLLNYVQNQKQIEIQEHGGILKNGDTLLE